MFLENVVGSKACVRLLRVLHSNPHKWFFAKELSELSGLGQGVTLERLERLVQSKVLDREARGRMTFYRLNLDSPMAIKIVELFDAEKDRYPKLPFVQRAVLSEYASRLESVLKGNLLFIALFGSVARGNAGPTSDIDVLVVVKSRMKEKEISKVGARISEKFHANIAHTVVSLEELKKMVKSREPLIKNVQSEGIVLLGSEEEFRKILAD